LVKSIGEREERWSHEGYPFLMKLPFNGLAEPRYAKGEESGAQKYTDRCEVGGEPYGKL
jgi:hypothetical protein